MEVVSIVLFAVAALFGVFLALKHLKSQDAPLGVAALHGLFAASGLVVLIISALQTGAEGLGLWSLILFVVAALGGFVLLVKHLQGKALGRGLIAVHGLVAVIAFVLLLVVYLGAG